MRLDAQVLRYLTRDDFRVLTAIEMGMKNHELVPTPLICSIAALEAGPGAAFKIINTLHRNKLIYHERKVYDGYRLTYLGYDYLALRTYVARGLISGLGRRIGVGKEADIYECCNEAGEMMVLKIHRLGRISFRQIKNKRDYLLHRKNASWMYMSRLAAIREFTYMKALYDHGFPVPVPYDQSRHTILMSFIDAFPFGQVKQLNHTGRVYSELLNLIIRLAEHGLIHADFNEFNLLIDNEEKITLIDFPQMVSTRHPDAEEFFNRDVGCITRYFSKRFGYLTGEFPKLDTDVDESKRIDLDKELAASGHAFSFASEAQRKEFENYIAGKTDGAKLIETANGEVREEVEDDEDEDDEDDSDADEEALVKSLGINADDLVATSSVASSSSTADAEAAEIEKLKANVDGELRADDDRAAEAAKKKGKVVFKEEASKKSAVTASENAAAEEEDEEEEDEEAEEAARRERMARKDARQRSHAQAQQLKAARKEKEKERKRREREGLPPLEEAAPASSASSSVPLTAASIAATSAERGDQVESDAEGEEEEEEQDDRRSVTSALSQLGMHGKSVLNIQLPKPQIRLKRSNRNKDREKKKIHASIKEHL